MKPGTSGQNGSLRLCAGEGKVESAQAQPIEAMSGLGERQPPARSITPRDSRPETPLPETLWPTGDSVVDRRLPSTGGYARASGRLHVAKPRTAVAIKLAAPSAHNTRSAGAFAEGACSTGARPASRREFAARSLAGKSAVSRKATTESEANVAAPSGRWCVRVTNASANQASGQASKSAATTQSRKARDERADDMKSPKRARPLGGR
jgi:hypothetical protein